MAKKEAKETKVSNQTPYADEVQEVTEFDDGMFDGLESTSD